MSKRVLIADDIAELRQLLSIIIGRDAGFTVVGEAPDGQEALEKAKELAPDLVLLDVNMPRKSGLEVLPEIRSALPDATIVMFSGFDADTVGPAAARLGADAYLEKGTPGTELLSRLHELVDKKSA